MTNRVTHFKNVQQEGLKLFKKESSIQLAGQTQRECL